MHVQNEVNENETDKDDADEMNQYFYSRRWRSEHWCMMSAKTFQTIEWMDGMSFHSIEWPASSYCYTALT